MIEPLLGFGEGHLMRSDSLENVSVGAPYTLRIRELFEQTTAQGIQDASFVSNRISFWVQIRATFPRDERFFLKVETVAG